VQLLVDFRPVCDGGQHLAATATRALEPRRLAAPGAEARLRVDGAHDPAQDGRVLASGSRAPNRWVARHRAMRLPSGLNEFFRLWLDERMHYTSAVYDAEHTTLEQAQRNKSRWLADFAEVGPDSLVLDIGCGWGAHLEYLALERKVKNAHGITLSSRSSRRSTPASCPVCRCGASITATTSRRRSTTGSSASR
jgi:hypothetical protein